MAGGTPLSTSAPMPTPPPPATAQDKNKDQDKDRKQRHHHHHHHSRSSSVAAAAPPAPIGGKEHRSAHKRKAEAPLPGAKPKRARKRYEPIADAPTTASLPPPRSKPRKKSGLQGLIADKLRASPDCTVFPLDERRLAFIYEWPDDYSPNAHEQEMVDLFKKYMGVIGELAVDAVGNALLIDTAKFMRGALVRRKSNRIQDKARTRVAEVEPDIRALRKRLESAGSGSGSDSDSSSYSDVSVGPQTDAAPFSGSSSSSDSDS